MDDFRAPPAKKDPRANMPSVGKKLGENIFGTTLRKAEGAKTVRPNDPNTTSAKRVEAYETLADVQLKQAVEEERKLESFLTDIRRKMNQGGYITPRNLNNLKEVRKLLPRSI